MIRFRGINERDKNKMGYKENKSTNQKRDMQSRIYCSEQPIYKSNLSATKRWIKMQYLYIQWNITQPKKQNEILPLAKKKQTWMDLKGIV